LKKADKWKPTGSSHGEAVSKLITQARARTIGLKDGSRADWKQIDDALLALNTDYLKALTEAKIALQQNQQGGNVAIPEGSSELLALQLKFNEIFSITDDALLFPLTRAVAIFAPESSFAGLTVYGKHGEVKTRITGKFMTWSSGITQYSYTENSSYTTLFHTDKGQLYAGGDGDLVKWGDIKNKIGFDYSEAKNNEDSEMERQALSRH